MDNLAETQAQQAEDTPPQGITLDEYENAGDRVEVIDGELRVMSPPKRPHTLIMMNLQYPLHEYVEEHGLGRVWADQTPYRLDGEDRTDWVRSVYVPDLSFVSADRAAAHNEQYGTDGPWRLAPDLAVEIVSPTDSFSAIVKKVADYLAYGVRLVWVIDPENRQAHIYTAETPNGQTLSDDGTLTGGEVIPGWQMPVTGLFAGL